MAEHALHIGLIGDASGWHLRDLARAGRDGGHQVSIIPWTALGSAIQGEHEQLHPLACGHCDALIIRGMPRGGLEEVVFRMNAVARLEAAGTTVINPPRSLEIAIDKYLTTARLVDARLPVPRTAVAQEADAIRAQWNALGGDVVLKPLFGSCGRGLERLASAAELETFLDRRRPDSPAYLQEFLPHPEGDIRVLLVGERAFAIRRRSQDWRTNVSLGAIAEPLEPTAEMLELARRAAAAVGSVLAGVDLLPTADGRLVVLEVNAVPGWKGVSATCGVDIAAEVIALTEAAVSRSSRPSPAQNP
jgi:RimK family alpha-L-glutamate ligase